MGETVLTSKDGKSVAKLPHLPVNHATHINLTKDRTQSKNDGIDSFKWAKRNKVTN